MSSSSNRPSLDKLSSLEGYTPDHFLLSLPFSGQIAVTKTEGVSYLTIKFWDRL